MDSVKIRNLIPALLVLLFFGLCVHYSRKAGEGPWHENAMSLWNNENWQKLRSLAQNLHDVGKEDVEAFYLGMLASEQLQDFDSVRSFASAISDTRVLNWGLEKRISKSYRPESLRKKVALFRTRIVFSIALVLAILVLVSLRKREPYRIAPALLSVLGIGMFLI